MDIAGFYKRDDTAPPLNLNTNIKNLIENKMTIEKMHEEVAQFILGKTVKKVYTDRCTMVLTLSDDSKLEIYSGDFGLYACLEPTNDK